MKTLIKCFLLIALILSTSSCSKDQLRDDDHFTVEDLNPVAAERFATCTKVEYDGKVITPKKGVTIIHYEFPDPYEDVDVTFVNYLVDIVVDR